MTVVRSGCTLIGRFAFDRGFLEGVEVGRGESIFARSPLPNGAWAPGGLDGAVLQHWLREGTPKLFTVFS